MCVPIRPGFLTSTCCPKWTVGCSAGTVGCCDPARPWQLALSKGQRAAVFPETLLRSPSQRNRWSNADPTPFAPEHDATVPQQVESATVSAYALFPHPIKSAVKAIGLDISSGAVAHSVDVTGPFADYYNLYDNGDTRIIPWARHLAKFVFADVDQANTEQIISYTIDPATGSSTSTKVSGCKGYPVGMAWDTELGKLVIGTQTKDEASLCAINVTSGEGTALGSVARGSDESSAAFYAAYISLSSNGVVHRVGNKDVTQGTNLGVATTDASKTTWTALSLSAEYEAAVTVNMVEGEFISLAARSTHDETHDLDLIRWDPSAKTGTKVLANLTDAHTPVEPYTAAQLGYVADSVSGNTYAAITIAEHKVASNAPRVPGLHDKWTVTTYDLSSGKLAHKTLFPQPSLIGGAETTAVMAFGLI
eukprot:CAMPEP_0175866022 /NCGR_PEP_ID=MMETSP0107_2-20121207/33983_1 /TAXON_ID=195067 ORGANISM="Goniomonas pacifica, Strain CCMP1869" /NCGR_SAMPLE_ID=MMETSP0107_2 /ASSEMBLY_ACC=CAM_ASM_000203 /LENGTH=420 /DNA_ID=CAMNT_0017183513 /DNA_START=40 /DNA_END=1302 /DNA_ORIENTATION=-